MVESRFCSAVIRASTDRDQRKGRSRVYDTRLLFLGLKEWQESSSQLQNGKVVCRQLLGEDFEVDGLRFGEIEPPLNPGVEEDAVQIRIVFD